MNESDTLLVIFAALLMVSGGVILWLTWKVVWARKLTRAAVGMGVNTIGAHRASLLDGIAELRHRGPSNDGQREQLCRVLRGLDLQLRPHACRDSILSMSAAMYRVLANVRAKLRESEVAE